MQLYVHDYLIDYLGSDRDSQDIYCEISVFYSLKEMEEDDDGVMSLNSFSISAGTPSGIGKYLHRSFQLLQSSGICLFDKSLLIEHFDEKKIYQFIKNRIEVLRGRTENELILRVMKDFEWVHDNPAINDEFSYLLYNR